jgi:hypothetical protein
MSAVNGNREPFGLGSAYNALSPPNQFGNAGAFTDAGISSNTGGGIAVPGMQKDSIPTTNRVIPYTRVVPVTSSASTELKGLKYGDVAFLGKNMSLRGRKKGGRALVAPTMSSGVDSPSRLATIEYLESELKDNTHPFILGDAQLKPDDSTELPTGIRHMANLARGGIEVEVGINDSLNIYPTSGQLKDNSCFLWPLAAHLTDPKYVEDKSVAPIERKRRKRKNKDAVDNPQTVAANLLCRPKIPTDKAKVLLDMLYKRLDEHTAGAMPLTRWTPDGIVIYRYTTEDGSSEMSSETLDHMAERRQGAMFNIAVAGPATTFAWTSQENPTLSKRCICLPRNMYYLLVVAKQGLVDAKQAFTKFRLLRTTSFDLNQYSCPAGVAGGAGVNSGEGRMGLDTDEVIIGGWQIGSVMDNSAAPMSTLGGGASLTGGPNIRSGAMGARIAVSIKPVSPFDLHLQYWRAERHPMAKRMKTSHSR